LVCHFTPCVTSVPYTPLFRSVACGGGGGDARPNFFWVRACFSRAGCDIFSPVSHFLPPVVTIRAIFVMVFVIQFALLLLRLPHLVACFRVFGCIIGAQASCWRGRKDHRRARQAESRQLQAIEANQLEA